MNTSTMMRAMRLLCDGRTDEAKAMVNSIDTSRWSVRERISREVDELTEEQVVRELKLCICSCSNMRKAIKLWMWERLTGHKWEGK